MPIYFCDVIVKIAASQLANFDHLCDVINHIFVFVFSPCEGITVIIRRVIFHRRSPPCIYFHLLYSCFFIPFILKPSLSLYPPFPFCTQTVDTYCHTNLLTGWEGRKFDIIRQKATFFDWLEFFSEVKYFEWNVKLTIVYCSNEILYQIFYLIFVTNYTHQSSQFFLKKSKVYCTESVNVRRGSRSTAQQYEGERTLLYMEVP